MNRFKVCVLVLVLCFTARAFGAINFTADYSLEGAGEGFNDPVNGAQRKAAFEFTLGFVGSYFAPRYAGETVVVRAKFDPLGGTASSAVLASASASSFGRDFAGASQASTFFPRALVNHLSGSDSNGATAEIDITFNSDVDNSTVLGGTSWYYGTNRTPGANIDMVTTAMHEIGHGLGFSSFLTSTGAYNGSFPSIWDRFLNTSNVGGTKLPSLASDALRLAERTGNDLWWDGANGVAGNGGTRPRIYAPTTFSSGSSLSHLDETIHPSDLMSPFDSGPANYSSMDLGMFQDMGWLLVPEPSALILIGVALFPTLARRSRR